MEGGEMNIEFTAAVSLWTRFNFDIKLEALL